MIRTLQHALLWFEEAYSQPIDWVSCLQPTSPLRTARDIAHAVTCACDHYSAVVGVTNVEPLGSIGGASFKTNGAIYMVRRDVIERGALYGDSPRLYYMPPERSIDIDTLEDFDKAEALWKSGLLDEHSGSVVGHT